MDFSKMTAAQLKEYAKENGIDLGDAKTKTAIIGVISGLNAEISAPNNEEKPEGVISIGTKPSGNPSTGVRNNIDGIFTSAAADRVDTPKNIGTPKPVSKVAVHSIKNVHWQGVGHLNKGYNIVTKEAAAKWLTKSGIREATPEEVATHYGKI